MTKSDFQPTHEDRNLSVQKGKITNGDTAFLYQWAQKVPKAGVSLTLSLGEQEENEVARQNILFRKSE